MALVPVPGIGAGVLEPGRNFSNWIDSIFLKGVMLQSTATWDPEGILSTFPAIVSGMTGMLVGRLYLDQKDDYRRLSLLFFTGFALFLAGGLWNWFFPINKNIWTSSYVLYTAGLATLTHTPSPMGFLNEILDRPAEVERPFLLLVTGHAAPGARVPAIDRKPLQAISSWR